MTPDRPHEPARSGPCLTRQHERCHWQPCACTCGHAHRKDAD